MSGYTRKKQPEVVRRAILDRAAELTVRHGIGALTVQAVAEAAGITKGGLFHHFPSKQALVESMLADLLEKFDRELDDHMATDAEPEGRFTRAYVAVSLSGNESHRVTWAALMGEPALCTLWAEWLNSRLERHRGTDSQPLQQIARLAADGLWLARMAEYESAVASNLSEIRLILFKFSMGPGGSIAREADGRPMPGAVAR